MDSRTICGFISGHKRLLKLARCGADRQTIKQRFLEMWRQRFPKASETETQSFLHALNKRINAKRGWA